MLFFYLLLVLVVVAGGLLIRGQGRRRGLRFWIGGGLMLAGSIVFIYLQLAILL